MCVSFAPYQNGCFKMKKPSLDEPEGTPSHRMKTSLMNLKTAVSFRTMEKPSPIKDEPLKHGDNLNMDDIA